MTHREPPPTSITVGGIVLCGGQSRRMGQPKLMLPFGPELMIHRVLRLLGFVVDPLIVVAASDQPLPDLDTHVTVVRDEQPDLGPLEGLRIGLEAIEPHADSAYVTGCDVPLLVPDFVRHLVESLDDHEIVVPVDGEFHHPLAAVYRPAVVDRIAELLDAGRRRPIALFEQCRTRRLPVDELRQVDPDLDTLRNLNHPEDYQAALRRLEQGDDRH